jgi:hypothetical protein
LEPLPAHAKPEGEEEEEAAKSLAQNPWRTVAKSVRQKDWYPSGEKYSERVQEFQKVHDRASLFYIVLLIYNVFDAGILGGKFLEGSRLTQ